jgi:SWI/SNF-related matrix-associated actin-dependent regulator 1 of chromatin subfamily A
MIKMTLYKYQSDGIQKLYNIVTTNAERAAMLCDPPGAGKTPQAIGLYDALGCRSALIICPASLKVNWQREIARWSKRKQKVQVLNSSADKLDETADIVIISFALACRMHEKLTERSYDLLVIDESHYLKSASSQVSRIVLVILWGKCHFRLLMTGTPLPNGRAVEAYTTFSRCSHEDFGSWESYKKQYCIEERTRWGVTYPGSKNLSVLKEKSARFMVRRSKEEVLQQLPGLVRQNIPIRLPEMDIFNAEDGIDVDAIVNAVENDLPIEGDHITTVRRKLAMLKAPHILQHIEETLEEVEQLVVFLHHRDLMAHLTTNLSEKKISHVCISGLTLPEDRIKSVDIFQSGKAQVFLASLKAANTGLTLTKASTLLMAEYDWVPSTNEQAEGRIYRVSQNEICRVRYLVASDSLDEKILKVVQRKQREINKALGQV